MMTNAPAEPHSANDEAGAIASARDFVRVVEQRRALLLPRRSRSRWRAGARGSDGGQIADARFGFTVTKKVAGAVGRNRIRRRLKEALRVSGALGARPGRDYVFVARRAALDAPLSPKLSLK